jgi:hypothetical protein
MDTPAPLTNLHEVSLKQQAVGFSIAIPESYAYAKRNMEFSEDRDRLYNLLTMQLRTFLLRSGHEDQHVEEMGVPSTWWQHLKQDHFPAWLLRRFPVKFHMKKFTYEKFTYLCPHADLAWPDPNHIEFMQKVDPKMSTESRKFLIDVLKQLEAAIPPPQHCHHAITFARYGSDLTGWEDKLALQINSGGKFHCFFLDDQDFRTEPARFVESVVHLMSEHDENAQLGVAFGQYTMASQSVNL